MDLINRQAKAKIRIISRSSEPFRDRVQAGELLAFELVDLKSQSSVVLGIPRGGVIIAQVLAREIEADLDVVLSRKLGALGQSELAMGAIAENGEVFLNPEVVSQLYIPKTYLEQEKERQMTEIKRRSQLIRAILSKLSLKDRIVVVTDDGIATGATMQAAVWAIRNEQPQKIIVAVPVASEEAVQRLSIDVDEIICLRMPDMFVAVGQFYLRFDQVTDEEVIEILRREKERRSQSPEA